MKKQMRAVLVERYREALALRGRANLIVDQAMAIEESMTQLSALLREVMRPEVKVQIIRAREELRKEWLNLIAQAGIVDVKPTTASNSVTASLTDEGKSKLIEIGYKRLEKLRAAKVAAAVQPRQPVGVEPRSTKELGASDEAIADEAHPVALGKIPSEHDRVMAVGERRGWPGAALRDGRHIPAGEQGWRQFLAGADARTIALVLETVSI